MKDPNRLIKIEKAILEKYGEETIQNPKTNWDEEKEKAYLEQIRKIAKSRRPKEKVTVNGILMPKKLFNKESKRTCPSCQVYSFDMKDDLYMVKFKCCYKCYVQHVEDREERWFKKLNLEQEEQ
jgi:hypothetical protein